MFWRIIKKNLILFLILTNYLNISRILTLHVWRSLSSHYPVHIIDTFCLSYSRQRAMGLLQPLRSYVAQRFDVVMLSFDTRLNPQSPAMAAVSGLVQYSLRKVSPQGRCFNASHFRHARIYWNTPVSNKNSSGLLFFVFPQNHRGSFWRVEPSEGEVPAESQLVLKVVAHLKDTLQFQDKLKVSIQDSQTLIVSVSATGTGTTIVSNRPLGPNLDLGTFFR